jgi:hypothetical protein
MEKSSRGSTVVTQMLFFLRFIQLGSIVLAGFIAVHFVYWHNRIHDPIPSGEIAFIAGVSHFRFPLIPPTFSGAPNDLRVPSSSSRLMPPSVQ